jgi:hypothetical protein
VQVATTPVAAYNAGAFSIYDVLQEYPDVNVNADILLSTLNGYSNAEANKNSIFNAVTKNIFGKQITLYENYDIVDFTDGQISSSVGYRTILNTADDDRVKSYAEDTSFDWESIGGLQIKKICATTKSNKLNKVEFYSENIASYSKTTTQIWNGETVTKWYGDRVSATKSSFEITYGTTKKPIEIPAQ